jgi:hypothetical protein
MTTRSGIPYWPSTEAPHHHPILSHSAALFEQAARIKAIYMSGLMEALGASLKPLISKLLAPIMILYLTLNPDRTERVNHSRSLTVPSHKTSINPYLNAHTLVPLRPGRLVNIANGPTRT